MARQSTYPAVTRKFHRKAFLCERYDCSGSSISRYVAAGKIPRPRYLNGQCIWTDEQVEEADRNLITDDPTPPAVQIKNPHIAKREGAKS